MKKDKLFVFLHGNSFDKDNNKEEMLKIMSHFPNWEYYCFDSPHVYPKYNNPRRRSWFMKGENNIYLEDESYFESLKHVKDNINKKLEELGLTWKDLILCGRSQGSFAALLTALQNEEECCCLLTLGSIYVDYMKSFEIKSNPRFYWFEMENENVLGKEKTDGYKILQEKGIKLEWNLTKGSDYDNISDETIEQVINKLKECEK